MNRLLCTIYFIALCNLITAQNDSTRFENAEGFQLNLQEMDSTAQLQRKQHKVMMVMYDPIMQLPDPAGDNELAEEAKKDMAYIKKRIRLGLDISLFSRVAYLYETVDLTKEYEGNAANDAKKIYASLDYKYEIPNRLIAENKKTSNEDGDITNGQITIRNKPVETKYLNISISDPTLIPYLNSNYGTDLYLFITQLEIKKHFTDQIALSYDTYERRVKVHYALFDEKGAQMAGDVVDVIYPSATNDIEEIIRHSFPEIAKQIASSLPQPQRSANEEAIRHRTRSARDLNRNSRK